MIFFHSRNAEYRRRIDTTVVGARDRGSVVEHVVRKPAMTQFGLLMLCLVLFHALPLFLHANQAQSRSHALIRSLHNEDSVPVGEMSDEASLQAMLKTGGGYSAVGVLASYVSDAVSLPFDQDVSRRVEYGVGGGCTDSE